MRPGASVLVPLTWYARHARVLVSQHLDLTARVPVCSTRFTTYLSVADFATQADMNLDATEVLREATFLMQLQVCAPRKPCFPGTHYITYDTSHCLSSES